LGTGVLEKVAIPVLREGHRGVAKAPGDEEELLPRLDQVGDVRVPEVVEADPWKVVPGHPAVEHLRHGLWVEWSAVWFGEHEVAHVQPTAAHGKPVLGLLHEEGNPAPGGRGHFHP
jgi:hypothetical protein